MKECVCESGRDVKSVLEREIVCVEVSDRERECVRETKTATEKCIYIEYNKEKINVRNYKKKSKNKQKKQHNQCSWTLDPPSN